eukprot:2205520-Rhodomonas_salina.1
MRVGSCQNSGPDGSVDIRKEPGYRPVFAINDAILPTFKKTVRQSNSARKRNSLQLGSKQRSKTANVFCFSHEGGEGGANLSKWGDDERFKFSSLVKGIDQAAQGKIDPRVQVRSIHNPQCHIFCSQQELEQDGDQEKHDVRGLFATDLIPAYTVLGLYGGEVKEEDPDRTDQGSEDGELSRSASTSSIELHNLDHDDEDAASASSADAPRAASSRSADDASSNAESMHIEGGSATARPLSYTMDLPPFFGSLFPRSP